MGNLAIIPARGGSKRLPGKNIKALCGRPLIMFTVEAALESNKFDTIVVTSDSEEILNVCEGVDERIRLHRRPTYLASDNATVLETVNVIVGEEEQAGSSHEVVCLLLPTAPLRTAQDIQKSFELLSKDVDSVVSITEFDFPPQLGLMLDNQSLLQPYDESDPFRKGKTRSQAYPTVYRPNGAIYLSWWKSFLKTRNFFKGRAASYFMPRTVSADIDTELDLIMAAEIIRYYNLPMNTR